MWFFIGDLHLTDKASDAYRFNIFDWISKQQEKKHTAATFLAGDITDSKDRHSATLVNKIVSGLLKLQPPVYIAMGNHDYRDPKNPFFKFLNHIEGIHFVTKPILVTAEKKIGVIPHYRSQDGFDAAVRNLMGGSSGGNRSPDSFLVHQTFDGAIAESGVRLSGLSASLIESINPPLGVYAGDVHKPQTQGIVTYIGCPYHVRFGDNFEPQTIYVNQHGTESYPWFEAPRKWSLAVQSSEEILNNEMLLENDQVKLMIEVTREEVVDWKQIKQEVLNACKKMKLDVYGVKMEIRNNQQRKQSKSVTKQMSNTAILDEFCKLEKVPTQIKKAGEEFLNDQKSN